MYNKHKIYVQTAKNSQNKRGLKALKNTSKHLNINEIIFTYSFKSKFKLQFFLGISRQLFNIFFAEQFISMQKASFLS
ncbi:hypothetical protein BSF41_26800 [Flavobacterium sp. ACN2]|nr:hypothetical protein BSF41_26800 [Flavobacterium sp. ACN2]